MPGFLIRILSVFIPCKRRRKNFRNRFLASRLRHINGENNILDCPDDFRFNCFINGNGNRIVVEKSDLPWDVQLNVAVGLPDHPADNCTLKIGKNFTSNGTMIQICEDNTEVTIGDDCMFSAEVKLWASDTHTITDMGGTCINQGRYIHIGDHVWLGYGTSILKNTVIPAGCVCGCQSVVSGRFDLSNSVIAGNPAKVCKKDINWNRKRPQKYIAEHFKKGE